LIEFFDFSEGGLSVVEGDQGNQIVAEEGFAGEPLAVIRSEDIESWPEPSEHSSDYGKLAEGGVVSDPAFREWHGTELVFRLTVDGESYWGFVMLTPVGYSTPRGVEIGCPFIEFPNGFYGDFSLFKLVTGGIQVDGVYLAQAAWEAWSD
jgi:hypothetical protein